MNAAFLPPVSAPPPDRVAAVEELLRRQTLRTECRRTAATASFLALALIACLALQALPGTALPAFLESLLPQSGLLATVLAAYTLYEGGVSLWQARLLRECRLPRPWFWYLHVLVEITLPTLALWIGAQQLGPQHALLSSLPYLYFAFVFLTILHLDGWLSTFAGMAAGIQLFAMSVVLLWPDLGTGADTGTDTALAVTPRHALIKGLLLNLSGLLAGFVARRLRHHVVQALHAVAQGAVRANGNPHDPAGAAPLCSPDQPASTPNDPHAAPTDSVRLKHP